MSVLLNLSWVILIAVGVILNGSLQWKQYFPVILQDALLYGKLKLQPASGQGKVPDGGIMSLLNIPKRWFTHFYAWGVVWNCAIFLHFLVVCILGLPPILPMIDLVITAISGVDLHRHNDGVSQREVDVAMVLLLVCVQVSRRLYECLCVSVFSESRMHILHYVLGMYFYTALGPTALLHLTTRAIDSGPGVYLKELSLFSMADFLHWYHLLGLLVFLWASWHQHCCHKILAALRHPSSDSDTAKPLRHKLHPGLDGDVGNTAKPLRHKLHPGLNSDTAKPVRHKLHPSSDSDTAKPLRHKLKSSTVKDHSYGLPAGDWFDYVSCPHYLAEVLIYTGLLLILVVNDWCTSWWFVVIFTTLILLLSGRQVHQWYVEKFEDYPKSRGIIFPRLY